MLKKWLLIFEYANGAENVRAADLDDVICEYRELKQIHKTYSARIFCDNILMFSEKGDNFGIMQI